RAGRHRLEIEYAHIGVTGERRVEGGSLGVGGGRPPRAPAANTSIAAETPHARARIPFVVISASISGAPSFRRARSRARPVCASARARSRWLARRTRPVGRDPFSQQDTRARDRYDTAPWPEARPGSRRRSG